MANSGAEPTGVIIPVNEPDRLAAIRRYDILDTPPDGTFDRITAIAARRYGVPISIISLVDHDRIWFKSHHGLDVTEIPRDPGLCASAILSDEPWILPDAKKNPLSLVNPLVAGEFGLRFYAGVPLRTHDGYNLGTLCVIDRTPHTVDKGQIADLRDLASVVMDQMELRLSARRAVSQAEMMSRELDHRVMNSLQFVGSMLAMQSRTTQTPEVASELRSAADRVITVARVHRHFHSAQPTKRTACLQFLSRLCEELSGLLDIPINVRGIEAIVPTAQIQPIGLIANELLTNSAKHGASRIEVSFLTEGNNTYTLAVVDDGPGLPAGFDLPNATGLGIKLMNVLTRQLGGTLRADVNSAGRGTRLSLVFPAVSGDLR